LMWWLVVFIYKLATVAVASVVLILTLAPRLAAWFLCELLAFLCLRRYIIKCESVHLLRLEAEQFEVCDSDGEFIFAAPQISFRHALRGAAESTDGGDVSLAADTWWLVLQRPRCALNRPSPTVRPTDHHLHYYQAQTSLLKRRRA